MAIVRHYEHRVYVSKSHEELLGQNSALLGEDGQNCREKPRGISGTEIPQNKKTNHEWGGCLGTGNNIVEDDGRRLEDDEDDIDKEDAGGEV